MIFSCKCTYTEFGGVATKQDARGVVTTFTYDALHHVTQKSYNTSGVSGAAATSPLCQQGSVERGELTELPDLLRLTGYLAEHNIKPRSILNRGLWSLANTRAR